MFDMWSAGRNLQNFAYANTLYEYIWSYTWGISASIHSVYLKHYLCRFIHNMIIPIACVSVADVLNDFVISFLCQF